MQTLASREDNINPVYECEKNERRDTQTQIHMPDSSENMSSENFYEDEAERHRQQQQELARRTVMQGHLQAVREFVDDSAAGKQVTQEQHQAQKQELEKAQGIV